MAESGDHHDALFKWSFGQLDRAAGELRAILPAPLAAAIDWASIELVSGSFVDENLGRRHSDLVYAASWQRGGDLLVYVLFEHQSSAEPLMAFRLLRYMVRIWDRWLADHPSARHLPPIIPVVLSHGPPWSAARQFCDLLAVPDPDRPIAADLLVSFEYLVDDLSSVADPALIARPITAVARLALLLLKHARSSDLVDQMARWAIGLLRDAQREEPDAIEPLLRYILMVNKSLDWQAFKERVARRLGPGTEEQVVTLGEQLIEQGRQQGLQQGRQQGLEQGRMLALTTIERFLQRLGVELDAELLDRLRSTSAEQLDTLGPELLDAPDADAAVRILERRRDR
jgi:predicted transposase/invertase (TIGR01784 family)